MTPAGSNEHFQSSEYTAGSGLTKRVTKQNQVMALGEGLVWRKEVYSGGNERGGYIQNTLHTYKIAKR